MPAPVRLGKYDLRRELGRGAMGIVYEAFDPSIERVVAVKVLGGDQAHATAAAEVRARFRREAQAAGRLAHPSIVAVYDYGEEHAAADGSRGGPFIVMERIEGRTLKALLEGGERVAVPEAARIVTDLLAALDHAHGRGVVHRDVKPGNVMLTDQGAVKVADFGIARVDSSDLTASGAVLGTANYMSPEQLLGQPVDRRTDLFACGVILYQLLTGDLPFTGSPATVMQKILNQEPLAPTLLNKSLSPAWDVIVRRALAKSPAARFQTADAFAAAVRAAAGGADDDTTIVTPAPPRARRPRRMPALAWAGAGGAVLAAAAYALFAMRPSPTHTDVAATQSDAAVRMVSTAPTASAAAPTASPAPAASAPLPEPSLPPASSPLPAALAPPASASRPTPSVPPDDIERLAWEDALKANTAPAYRAFLQGYGHGRYAGRARVRIAALELPPAASVPSRRAPEAQPAEPVQQARVAPVTPPAAPSASAGWPACADTAPVDRRCQLRLGYANRDGKDRPVDTATAARWFAAAAAQGEPTAQYELGWMYLHGQGVPKDDAEGVRWIRRAADQAHAGAQNSLGFLYETGTRGVAANVDSAVKLYRLAADGGLPRAMNNLGRMYWIGRGVPQDLQRARSLFEAAADKGDADACYNLGLMHERGEGVQANASKASDWYRRALERKPLSNRDAEAHAKAFTAGNR
jgi:serine/threonine protein kinase/TPR repeat protein